jgi:transcriptional regulator with XRE-family HTH domain
MAENRNHRGCQITAEGIKLIEKIRKDRGWNKSQLAEYLIDRTEIQTISRILRIKRGDKTTIDLIAIALDISPTDLVDENEWFSLPESSETKASVVNWRSVSKGMLDNLKRLTTEALTAGDGIRFDLDDVFVPLGVVERQEKTKRKEDDGAPDRGSELYEEKVTPITHGEFFEDVLLRGNTKISNGKRIAVIGEAGAGKTTQLQKIGSWLLEESDDIPVWISLTDLAAKSLREYLFENWVREASGEIEAAPQAWKDSLGDAIKSGKVWLLLDGVDEMTVSNPLSYLASQLKESWLKNVRVVLTCRVNVWDSGKVLTDFDVYRNLDFDYPDDVCNFIGKWFVRSPELAGSLTQALEQSGKERIRDMVKNPLRLTLLCYSWQKLQGGLPETKAGLYEWFVNTFYDWKREEVEKVTGVEINSRKIKELNKALGELAKLAIDSESSRFRLTETFIRNNMNPDLFDLADNLNWLNKVGDAAENPLEKVYAFYHPSFQEYFAALAIDDWDFFLPRDHVNKPVQGKQYRVFELNWNEVVLLWSGISQNSNTKNKSTLFIEKLLAFEDGCAVSNDYNYLGHLIALDIALESNNINLFDSILDEIIEWAFGCLDQNTHEWVTYINEEEARLKLKGVSREILINRISRLLPDISSENSILDVINFLLSINTTCSITIAIEYLLKLAIEPNFRKKSTGTIWHIQHHSRIIAGNSYLIKLFVGFIFSLDPDFRYIIFGFIQDPTLSKLMYSQDSNESVYLLEKIFVSDPEKLIAILDRFNFMEFYFESLNINLESIKKSPKSINWEYLRERWDSLNTSIAFEDSFPLDDYEYEPEEIVCCEVSGLIADLVSWMTLPEEPDHEEYMNASSNVTRLIDLLKMSFDFEMYEQYLEIDYENLNSIELHKIAVRNLYQSINSNSDRLEGLTFCYKALFFCAQNMSYPDFYDAWHCQSTFIHPQIVDIIPSNNTNAIQILESQLIDFHAVQKELVPTNERSKEIRCIVVDIHHLEQESDPNVIAKKLTNKIFNSIGRRIPVVQEISCLERELLNLKLEPDFEKLAIALYGKSANEAIDQLCQNLTESIPIRPFAGGQTTQELIAKINAWLSEM